MNTLLTIHVDGQVREVDAPCTLAALITSLSRPDDSFATALNGEFVARHLRASRDLADGDVVTCIQAIVGG